MKIETKFDVGQEVYFMCDNKVQHAEVLEIDATILSLSREYSTMQTKCRYEVNFRATVNGGLKFFDESELFATKEDLLKSL